MAYYLSDDDVERIRDAASSSGESKAYKLFLSMIGDSEIRRDYNHDDTLMDNFLEDNTSFKGNLQKKINAVVRLAKRIMTLDEIIDARLTINEDFEKFEEERNEILEAVDMDNPVFDALFSFDFSCLAVEANEVVDKFIVDGLKALVGLYNSDDTFYEYGNFFAVRAYEDKYILIYSRDYSYSWID